TDATGTFTASPPTDEFGVGQSPPSRLGWLGGHERFAVGNKLGLMRMGVRLYDPALGRFLQVDPIEGGNDNDYEYCSGDPINCFDLDGMAQHGKKNIRHSPEEVKRARQVIDEPWKHSTREINDAQRVIRQQGKAEKARRSRQSREQKKEGRSEFRRNAGWAGAISGALVGAWWAGKWLSPACGPAAPVCVVVL
ncbi:MAG TPA: RHS repeat-associated core domain-containing protein, partial [Acidimicrobiales bacterium]|nr:RHS repeat-associated core domain-containing protein [Acidimicrobiales bacterium]